jgi:aspartyl-tRNA(Asn)/glutamyl-tRNA(Gln) amidotransferase subunit A
VTSSARDPFASARDLRDAIASRALSAEDACRAALARLDVVDAKVHAFKHVDAARAIARAKALDASADARGPLHGVPIALKDNIAVRGMPATAGSKILEYYIAPFDATVTERLERAGAVILGKTICDEFAMGSSTENSAYGPSRNPWALDRIPGGSSGGSAVAVAAGITPLALGSDTGGSIRQPAALCGVVGLKPTYGRVSRFGLIAFASSLDQIGPFARTVDDAALCLRAIMGPDPRDATSARDVADVPERTGGSDLRGRTIGVPFHLLEAGVDHGVRAAFDESLALLEDLGATIRPVTLAHSGLGIAVYYILATAEASANLARFDGVRYGLRAAGAHTLGEMYDRTRSAGFGAEVKRRIMLGTYVLSSGYYDAYYLKAQQVRALIRRDFDDALRTVDAIALPTSPTPAFKFGERTHDPLQMYLADIFTVGAPLAGLPAISVPGGFTEGLPVGLQFIARAWDEATLFDVSGTYERAAAWAERPGL